MSYINQALKKAQKEKDAVRVSYIRSIGRTGSSAESVQVKGYIFAVLAGIILVAGGIYYIVKGNSDKAPEVAAIPAAIEYATDVKRENRHNTINENVIREEVNAKVPEMDTKGITDIIEDQYKRAVLLLKEKRVKDALAIYMKILDKDPGHIASLNDIGALYLHEGKYADAIIHLEKAVRLKRGFVTPCYNLACAYALNNEPEKGMAYLEKAVDIDKEVKAWAKKDPDLKNLRGQSGFITLIE